jgi:hypothetical protein
MVMGWGTRFFLERYTGDIFELTVSVIGRGRCAVQRRWHASCPHSRIASGQRTGKYSKCCDEIASESMAASDVVLYTYWRSSCSWRVRIALQWKGLPYDSRFVNLVANGGQQHSADYIDVNPQKLVSVLRHFSQAQPTRFMPSPAL